MLAVGVWFWRGSCVVGVAVVMDMGLLALRSLWAGPRRVVGGVW